MIRLRKVVMVILAFAESETASTTTLGLGFPTVWVQTPHRFGLFYDGLEWSYITLEYCPKHSTTVTMERGWVLGNVVCLFCRLFFLVAFETHSQG
jgi:hypothetical protein